MVGPCPHVPENPCKVRIFQNHRKTTNEDEKEKKEAGEML